MRWLTGAASDLPAQPVTPLVSTATTVPQLLAALAASDPGRPRLTWYDDAPGPTCGERIELSARVLANWVAKAANLLVDELDVEPGDRVVIELPTHWRAGYWMLAAWSAGAEVLVGGRPQDARVLVTDSPAAAPKGPVVVAVTLPALARSWAGVPLPSGAVDEAAAVTGQPDLFEPFTEPDGAAPALTVGNISLLYDELLASARGVAQAQGWQVGARVLTSAGPGAAVAALLAPLCVDGSLVLVRDPDPDLIDQRRQDERVTNA